MSNKLKFLFVAVIVLSAIVVPARTQAQVQGGFYYTYDGNGNRNKKQYTPIFIKKGDSTESQVKLGEIIIKVFPNPVNELLKIEIEGTTKNNVATIQFYNVKGENVYYEENINSSIQIPLKGWFSGVYFLVITIDGKPTKFKIVKED